MNIYKNYQPIKNKYYVWYYKLIEKAKLRTTIDGYFEKHHIVPRCLGGVDTSDNLVKLTLREHYVAHLLLTKFHEGEAKRKLYYGLWRLLLDAKNKNSRIFEIYRSKYIETSLKTYVATKETCDKISKSNIGVKKTRTEKLLKDWERRKIVYSGSGNPRYGVCLSEETKKKIGDANRGKIRTEEHKKKISESGKGKKRSPGCHVGEKNPMYGKKHSDETRRLISEAGKRRYQKLIETNIS